MPGGRGVRTVVNFYCVQQPFPPNLSDQSDGLFKIVHLLPENGAESPRPCCQFFILGHLKGCCSHFCGDRVSSEGRSVLAGPDDIHNWPVCKYGRYRIGTPRESLAQDEDVGPDIVFRLLLTMLLAGAVTAYSQKTACPGDSGLNFIAYEKYIPLSTHFSSSSNVPIFRNHHSRFALNGFDQKAGNIRIFESLFQRSQVVIFNLNEPSCIGTKVLVGIRII